MTDFAAAWAPIVKTSKNTDGTLYVYGKISDDALDRDQQKCDSAWLGRAVPQWFAEGGNIREQHSNIAAGVAIEHEAKADGHYIKALIVDPVSVKKVETKVLKGFSIGIKRPRVTLDKSAPGGRIVDGSIVETSLVDRFCNPGCSLAIVKADGNGAPELVAQELVEHPAPQLRYDPALVEKTDARTEALTASALRALADLIVEEASSLRDGQWGDVYDISRILQAVINLREFASSEAYETPASSVKTDGENVTETATPEATDPAATTPPAVVDKTDAPKADAPEGEAGPEFLTKADAADMVTKADLTSAVAEAVKTALPDALPEALTDAVTKAMEPVLDRLAKVEALPTPGGPVLTRTAGQTAAADGLDKSLVKAEYDDFLRKADEAQTNGSVLLAKGYREKAAALADRL